MLVAAGLELWLFFRIGARPDPSARAAGETSAAIPPDSLELTPDPTGGPR